MFKIKEIRKEKGILQKEIAEKLNKTTSCISSWETGITEPNIEDMIELANIFGCTVDYLLGRENEDGTIYIMGNQLSQSENELIDKLRQLDDTRKEIAYRYVDFLLNEQQKNYNL